VQSITYPGINHTDTFIRDNAGRVQSLHRSADNSNVFLFGGTSTGFDEYGRERYFAFGQNLYQYKGFAPIDMNAVGQNQEDKKGNKLASITIGKLGSAANIFNLNYDTYDSSGNLTKLYDQTQAGVNQEHNFVYDEMSRLLSATANAAGEMPSYNQSFSYESWTGRLSSRVDNSATGQPTSTSTFTYSTSKPHQVQDIGNGTKYVYDANGNITCRTENGITYQQSWTADNLLKKVQWNDLGGNQGNKDCTQSITYSHEVTFTYDAAGAKILRIEKVKDALGRQIEVVTVYINGLYEKQIQTGSGSLAPVTQSFTNHSWNH
jgi:hypothetical protein